MDYKTAGSLLARGARWGDIECFDVDEILLDLEKRRGEIETAKANRCLFRASKVPKAQPKTQPKTQPKAQPKTQPKAQPKTQPRRFSKCLPKCIGCKKFTIHSNHPAYFTKEDKHYCCAYCNETGGKKHCGSCEQNR
jgi:hypothetical protein